ncbi:MAG TPA: RNA polymerase sigma factor [Bacteroidales bacterium]|nr:RNA polymerase sigma factor [Bacteroidales bacterium]HPE57565.1 RNA polymerase sigma factor [Bacteroidales bacterium]HRX95880.1 RNA polymerase sigma factor [Bacteroidales bacterium]
MTVDLKIVEGCIAGKRRSQSQLYKQLAPGMLGVCMRYCHNKAEAEDILQEAFIKVFRNIKSLQKPAAIVGWVRSIMVNTALTHYKKNKMYLEEITDDNIPDTSTSDEDEMGPVDPQILMNLIQSLPEGYKMVLNLYVFEGYTHKEIAEILEISENTSKSQLSKARKYIRKELDAMNLFDKKHVTDERTV